MKTFVFGGRRLNVQEQPLSWLGGAGEIDDLFFDDFVKVLRDEEVIEVIFCRFFDCLYVHVFYVFHAYGNWLGDHHERYFFDSDESKIFMELIEGRSACWKTEGF